MTTQGKRGRPQKPFITSWGEAVAGLRRERDGRWRIIATREAFTEPDERLAVARARSIMAANDPPKTITMAVDVPFSEAMNRLDGAWDAMHRHEGQRATYVDGTVTFHHKLDPNLVWPWLRRMLIDDPAYVARMVGIPQLATLAEWPMPTSPIRLQHLLDVYNAHSESKDETKREAANTFTTFLKTTKADTLADLTADTLKTYRDTIRTTKTPATAAAYFGRIKWVIAFGKSEGEDAVQIDAALSRLKVLKAPKQKKTHDPSPISREHFHDLLKAARRDFPDWHDRLLLSLNACLHLDECLAVQWDELNLDAGTFCTHRSKTGVIRAATLWPETIAALKARIRRGPHVFTSTHGKRFVTRGQWKTWEKLRTAAGCPAVQFDDIRDGSYTAACNASGVDEKFARLLAGHKSHGLQDNYVARNPSVVAPACDAVHRHYFC